MSKNSANSAIKHVFVLMLENRSFDHMFGFFANQNPSYSNWYNGREYKTKSPARFTMRFDPHHGFEDVVEQLCGECVKYPAGGPYPCPLLRH